MKNTPENSNKLSNIDYFASLKYPDFLKMWLASLFAGSSYWALIVVRGWVVYQLSDSNMLVGLVTFAAMIPRVLVTPFVGYLSDKFQRRKRKINLGNKHEWQNSYRKSAEYNG